VYVVRVRTPQGRLKETTVFSDVCSALRHMDAYIEAFPDYASEVEGTIGVLTHYDPLTDERPLLQTDDRGP
jgi:hypothetical protein